MVVLYVRTPLQTLALCVLHFADCPLAVTPPRLSAAPRLPDRATDSPLPFETRRTRALHRHRRPGDSMPLRGLQSARRLFMLSPLGPTDIIPQAGQDEARHPAPPEPSGAGAHRGGAWRAEGALLQRDGVLYVNALLPEDGRPAEMAGKHLEVQSAYTYLCISRS